MRYKKKLDPLVSVCVQLERIVILVKKPNLTYSKHSLKCTVLVNKSQTFDKTVRLNKRYNKGY
ncbi:1042_t:CDS:2 [Entrophospora sp. SA101]|nr:1042_t:CDS:2 [Entrophospora sp. SA101]